jgi:beta-phosphoglucomutase-like phosphatase (HAD superfamily)
MNILQIGILWDMDGVLIDSAEAHFAAWTRVLADYHIPYSREFFDATFGMNNEGILNRLPLPPGRGLGDKSAPNIIAEIIERKESAYRQEALGKTLLLPGVRDWLDYFFQVGVPQAVTSGAPQQNIDTTISELKLQQYFQSSISGFNLPSKPDPAVFLLNARQIGVPPARCIVIEDAIAGLEGALSAGMKCIAVTTTHLASSLQAADLVVDRLDEFPPSQVISLFAE